MYNYFPLFFNGVARPPQNTVLSSVILNRCHLMLPPMNESLENGKGPDTLACNQFILPFWVFIFFPPTTALVIMGSELFLLTLLSRRYHVAPTEPLSVCIARLYKMPPERPWEAFFLQIPAKYSYHSCFLHCKRHQLHEFLNVNIIPRVRIFFNKRSDQSII